MPVIRTRRDITFRTLLTSIAIAVLGLLLIGVLFRSFWPEGPRKPFRYASTIAGTGNEIGEPFGIAVNGSDIYVSDGQNNKIWRIDRKGLTVFAEGLDTPSAIAFDQDGNLLVADTGSHTIKSINRKGETSILAGISDRIGNADGDASQASFYGPVGLAISGDKVYVADTYNDRIRVIEGGKVATLTGGSNGFADAMGSEARFHTPTGLAIWQDKLLVADSGNHRIRAVEQDGRVWTLAGAGEGELRDGPVAEASFVQPTALTVHRDGTIFVADGNAIREISGDVSRSVRTVSNDHRGVKDGDGLYDARFNRPSGLGLAANGDLIVADSENRLVRRISAKDTGAAISPEQIAAMQDTAAEFRGAAPGRWPFDPPERPRDIAGTLGELRGDVSADPEHLWFHNGLDIAGAYGETARSVRDEKVLRPIAADNFNTLREMLRMPTMGYIHLRLGRDVTSKPFADPRFQFQRDALGRLSGVRVPRGAKFKAGDAIGTLNSMNHVHLIAGRSGSELNALDALDLPGVADTRPPVFEEMTLWDENWQQLETPKANSRIRLSGKARIVVRAYDQMDGNSDRRRLGVYSVSCAIRREPGGESVMTAETRFDKMPSNDLVAYIYAGGSKSGATGETIFRYIATNSLSTDKAEEGFLDASELEPGNYTVTVTIADRFENTTAGEFLIEVMR